MGQGELRASEESAAISLQGKQEYLHRWFALSSIPQSVTLLHWGKLVLDVEAQDLQVRPRERIGGELNGDTLKGVECEPHNQESTGRNLGPPEARHYVFFFFFGGWLQGEGGTTIGASFFRYMLSGSRALSRNSVASMSCHCHL